MIERSLSETLQSVSSGSGCAVLVEGEERGGDAWILQNILRGLGGEVTFYGRDGRDNLLTELPHFVEAFPNGKVAVILDRDFADDNFVEKTYTPEYGGIVFYWRRYCIENYLLEPALVSQCVEIAFAQHPEQTPKTLSSTNVIEQFLLEQCKKVASQAAGNLTIDELTQISDTQELNVKAAKYFQAQTEIDPALVLSELMQKYQDAATLHPNMFGTEAISARYENNLEKIVSQVSSLETAHRVIDGKRFLMPLVKRELKAFSGFFVSWLVHEVAPKNPPNDFRYLVEDRILPRWREARRLFQQ